MKTVLKERTMKKFIAAAAGLMLVGTMVSSACAEVTFSGDARARMKMKRDFGFTASDDDSLDSRVRVKVTATSKGGAYAKARIRIGDAGWDGTAATGAGGESSNLRADYAYIGVPMGPVAVEAGYMPLSFTKFYLWDERVDALAAVYKNDSTKVVGVYAKVDEDPAGVAAGDDDDVNMYAVLVNQKMGDWSATAAIAYADNETAGGDGVFGGTVNLTGAVGGLTLIGEVAMNEGVGSADDELGWYAAVAGSMDAISYLAVVGQTKDGFTPDHDFGGGQMIGGDGAIEVLQIGVLGDWTFGAVNVDYKVSEAVTLHGDVVYGDIDKVGSAISISGSVAYAVSEGATLTVGAGMVDPSLDAAGSPDETAIGAFAALEIDY